MMREIKFRVWDKDSKQMDLVVRLEVDDSGHIDTAEGYGGVYHNFELMEYTGLHDKNGREIYEGDLFEHKFGYTVFDDHPHAEMGTEYGVVTFDNGQFLVSTPGYGGRSLYELLLLNGHLNDMPDSDLFTMKVAGNIFENPELMEASK